MWIKAKFFLFAKQRSPFEVLLKHSYLKYEIHIERERFHIVYASWFCSFLLSRASWTLTSLKESEDLSLSLSLSDFFSICHPRWSSRKIGVVIEVHGESRRYFETNPSYLHEPPDSLPGHSANRLRICSSVCKYIQSPFTFNLHTLVALIIK